MWRSCEGGFSESYRKQTSDWHEALLQDLIAANVLSPEINHDEITVNDEGPWSRGGSETYLAAFSVIRDGQTSQRIVAKAMASTGGGLAARANDWADRARLLESFGVRTATYGVANAVVYQRWIPSSLCDSVRSAVEASTIIDLARGVGSAGFRPIALLNDLRCEGTDIYLIDLGSDLGPPGDEATVGMVAQLLLEELARWAKKSDYGELLRAGVAELLYANGRPTATKQ